jgi:4-diphosphocytidyl-2-C-methyl-D-erythritol kinase
MLTEEARAKVNLTLRVVGRRVDGYHDLESVVAFADCADRLSLTPGSSLDLKTIGPLADACGETADNLVLKAARLLGERVPDLKVGSFTLDKVLPVAAGIGGGSADAAAALRLLARLNGLALDDERLREVALLTGADVPVCLASRACDMTGVGETLLPLSLPKMPCVLVNPRVPVATKDVFAALGCATANCWSAPPMSSRPPPGRNRAPRSRTGSKSSPPVPTTWKPRLRASSP